MLRGWLTCSYRDERALLIFFYANPAVQTILEEGRQWAVQNKKDSRKNVKDGTLKEAANCLQQLIEKRENVKQSPDESDEQYNKRIWAHAQAEGCLWLPVRSGEGCEAYIQRFRSTGKVRSKCPCLNTDRADEHTSQRIHTWVRNQFKKQSNIILPIPPFQHARNSRALTGHDMFKASTDSARPPKKTELRARGDPAAEGWDLGVWTAAVADAWNGLPDDRKAYYTALADAEMKEKESVESGEVEVAEEAVAGERKRRE